MYATVFMLHVSNNRSGKYDYSAFFPFLPGRTDWTDIYIHIKFVENTSEISKIASHAAC